MKIAINGQEVEIPSSGPGQEVYSTEETRIGTWIDGRPVYRRVFVGTAVAGDTLVDSDVLTVINQGGYIIYTGSMTVPIPWCLHDKNQFAIIAKLKNGLFVRTDASFAGMPYFVWADYTKTTDQATIELPTVLTAQQNSVSTMHVSSAASAANAAFVPLEKTEPGDIAPGNEEV